jgi:predicted ATPase
VADLPTGTVTFLFTDVEGSTRLLQELGDEYASVLEEHRRVLRDAFERHGGVEVDTQGDAFFVAFTKATAALAAAADARDALANGPVRVRMGLHTGEPTVTDGGYVGIDVHRAARIAAAGHGGQILVSQATRDLAGADGLRTLGEHRLKDLATPELIFQLGEGDFPPLKSLNNSNLPLPAGLLLGRKKELADVLRLLRDSARLVAVTGPGGTGKTRFALEVAAELVERFRDGVWWVALAPVRDPQLVVPTIANVIGARNDLADDLRGKELLLLLDNFEQVVDAAPQVATLQEECPGLSVIVTSREPLHIAGEREYPLAPLAESPAVELFRQRAEAVLPTFEADYRTLADVCDRLDRLPLAIELAAARTKVVPADALLERLEQRLPLLTSRRRDIDERQRTLRATIEWSYDLLDDDEKRVFTDLAVFAGGFGVGAAATVCDVGVDELESMVDKSLLRRTAGDRFFMLETIHEYATERLDERVDSEAVHRRQAEWIRALTLEAREQLRGDRQVEWLDRIAKEHPNVRAALEFAIARKDGELALTICGSIGRFWVFRGHDREGKRWLDAALDVAADTGDEVRWRALYWNSILADGLGDRAAAMSLAQEALTLARRLEDGELIASASLEVIRRLLDAGDVAQAEALLDRATREATDEIAVSVFGVLRGQLLLWRGDAPAALKCFRAALEVSRQRQDQHLVAMELAHLGLAQASAGDFDASRASLGEGLALNAELRFPFGVADCMQGTARLLIGEGDPLAAAQLLHRADRLLVAVGAMPTGVDALLHDETWDRIRELVDAPTLDALRAELPPGELDEAVAHCRSYLD